MLYVSIADWHTVYGWSPAVGTVGIVLGVGGVAVAIAFAIVFILALSICMLKLGVW